jgi:hypothetical protein
MRRNIVYVLIGVIVLAIAMFGLADPCTIC